MTATERLVLVMPAYNEEGCIETVCRDWLAVLDAHGGSRFVAVDDGSRDRTGAFLDALAAEDPRLLILHQANQGHGASLLNGYRKALALGCDWVFQTDSDDQFVAGEFELLWRRRAEAPFVWGYRTSRQDGPHRLAVTVCLRLLNRVLFGAGVRDSNVPFRLMRSDLLARILPEVPPGVFAPNVFVSLLAAKSGTGFEEVPITHKERATGAPRLNALPKLARTCARCARELAAFRPALDAAAGRVRGRS